MGKSGLFLFIFVLFSAKFNYKLKSADVELGIRTRSRKMAGVD